MRASEHTNATSVYRTPERGHVEPSATDAVERVLDAGQRLVTERIELAKLDVQDAVVEKVSQTTKVVVPALFAFGGWWILMAGLVAWLDAYLVFPASLAIVGGAHVVIGGVLAGYALERGHGVRNGNGLRNGGARAATAHRTEVNP